MSIQISVLSDRTEKPDLGKANSILDIKDLDHLAQSIINFHWAPATFALNGDGVTRRRTIKNAEGVDTLVFDVDEGCTLNMAQAIFAPFKHIIVTSRNHQKKKGNKPACDRFRVVLFLEARITDDLTYKSTWFKVASQFPFVDKACKDISRFYYAGTEIISIKEKGNLVSVIKPDLTPNKARSKGALASTSNKGKLSKATLEFLVNLAPSGEIHSTHIKALFDMREQGYSLDDAINRSDQAFINNGLDWGYTEVKRVEDVYHNRETKYEARWPKQLKKNGKYIPDPKEPDNYEHLLSLIPITVHRNTMDEKVYLDSKGETPVDNLTLDKLCSRARKEGLIYSKEVIMQEINRIAGNNSFHPIKDLIDEIKPSSKDYIGQLLDTLEYDLDPEGTDEERQMASDVYDMYIQRWLIGCITKLYRPGAQNLTLVLYGPQGIGKSRWLSKLPPWRRAYGEGTIDPDNKDHELRHLDKFIWHIPELESVTGKREAGALKDYLTKDWISARPAYARQTREGHSICSFCGSVNVESFLNDWTGNRRFMTIPLLSIDAAHKVDTLKVWAQAKQMMLEGAKYWLDLEEIAELNELSRRFIQESPLDDVLSKILPGEDFMTAGEIFARFDYNPKGIDYARLGVGLQKMGIPKSRKRSQGQNLRGYNVNKSKLGK